MMDSPEFSGSPTKPFPTAEHSGRIKLSLGEGGDMLVTMAIAVIGGLLYSLLLTLLFLPAAYSLAYGAKHKLTQSNPHE